LGAQTFYVCTVSILNPRIHDYQLAVGPQCKLFRGLLRLRWEQRGEEQRG